MMRSDVMAVREMLAPHDPARDMDREMAREMTRGVLTDPDDLADRARTSALRPRTVRRALRRPYRRRWLLTLSAGITAAFVLLATGILAPRAGIDPAAASTAQSAARLAAAGTDPGPLTGERIWYQRSLGRYPMTVAVDGARDYDLIVTRSHEVWTAADGRYRIRIRTVGPPEFVSDDDRRKWIEDGSPSGPLTAHNADDRHPPDADRARRDEELMALPDDPSVLFAHFHNAAAGHSTGTYPEMFTLVGDALRAPLPMRPSLRAALYEVIARIPGVVRIPDTVDLAGRPVAGLAMPYSGLFGAVVTQDQLLFDPATAEPRGQRMVVTRDLNPLRGPIVVGYDTVEVRGFVGSLDETLAGP
jgi:hypothetical protein